jgi:hypothetical protein
MNAQRTSSRRQRAVARIDDSVASAGMSEKELLRDIAAKHDEFCYRRMISEAAYYRAEHRGFDPGHELEDWFAAEAQIADRIGIQQRTAN